MTHKTPCDQMIIIIDGTKRTVTDQQCPWVSVKSIKEPDLVMKGSSDHKRFPRCKF